MRSVLFVCCLAVLLSILGRAKSGKALPNYVKPCHEPDGPQRNQCMLDNFHYILPKLADGLPELGLRKVEPYDIDKIFIDFGNGTSLKLDAVLTNMKMFGMSTGRVSKVELDGKKMTLKVDMTVPMVRMISDFKANGKVLLFQFNSTGVFYGNLTEVFVSSFWQCNLVDKKGETYCIVEKPDINIKIKELKVRFDNLFPTEELNSQVNQAIDENIDILYDELKPIILETLKSILLDAVNRVHKLFTWRTLYPE